MIRISDIKLVPTQGAYYYEDVAALQDRSTPDSERWMAPAKTPGFRTMREIAETVSIGLVLDNGRVYWGDAVAVSYSGKAGRLGVYRAKDGIDELNLELLPALIGVEIASFRSASKLIESLNLHNASRYGASQALLAAVAGESKVTMTEVLCREWDLPVVRQPVPIQGSCGNDREDAVDKMIVNRVASLPHTQVDDIPKQLGSKGDVLLQYVRWLKVRIAQLGGETYHPVLHLDTHGAIAKIFWNDTPLIADYLKALEREAAPYGLRMESVFVAGSRDEQIQYLRKLKRQLREARSNVKLVADEWANTRSDIAEFARSEAVDMIHVKMPDLGGLAESVDAVLTCRRHGVASLLGGSCIETDLSARASVHVALACRPDVFLAKPGMGINEALQIVRNEMSRTLSLLP